MDKVFELALTKMHGGLAGHFGTAADHHMAMHKVHTAMAKNHESHATLMKAKAESSSEDHPDKALHQAAHEFHKAHAAHHEELANLHKSHAEHNTAVQACMDGDKAAKAAAAEGEKKMKYVSIGKTADGVEIFKQEQEAAPAPADPTASKVLDSADIKSTVSELMGSALTEAIKEAKDSPEFKEMFKKAVMAQVAEQLGDTLVPTKVKGALADVPNSGPQGTGPTLVNRPGAQAIDVSKVPAEFQDAIGV